MNFMVQDSVNEIAFCLLFFRPRAAAAPAPPFPGLPELAERLRVTGLGWGNKQEQNTIPASGVVPLFSGSAASVKAWTLVSFSH